MAYRKMTVEYILDDREIEALEELLGKWQQYKGKYGSQPFEDWKLEDLFQAIMQYGCKYDISKHIKTDQYRHELIEVSEIAEKYGTTYQKIASMNGIQDPNKIYAGQKIRVK